MLADTMDAYPTDGLRILEVGCGLGLASLVVHNHGADITASDYHPLAETFMLKNIGLNNFAPIKFEVTNWAKIDNSLGKFDLIIGSDVLYEPNHPMLLANFIERQASGNCKVIIVDSGAPAAHGIKSIENSALPTQNTAGIAFRRCYETVMFVAACFNCVVRVF
jgi:predicted nicotinamide N-methyase